MKPIESIRYRYSGQNPLALSDRRYRLTKFLHRRGYPLSFQDDQPTRELLSFQRKRGSARNSLQRVQLLREYRDLAIAFVLHHGDPGRRVKCPMAAQCSRLFRKLLHRGNLSRNRPEDAGPVERFDSYDAALMISS